MARLAMLLGGAAVLPACDRRSTSTESAAAVEAQRRSTAPDARPRQVRHRLPPVEPVVRVRVGKIRGSAAPVRIGAERQWVRLSPVDADAGQARIALHGPLRVRIGDSGWSIIDARGFRPSLDGLEPVELSAVDSAEGLLAFEDRRYPGSIRLVARTDLGPPAFDLVNHVAVEAYLPGVVAKELYQHWHPQTHAAQAIAARSFACSEHAQFGHRHYELTNTASSQVYIGSVKHRRALEAVAVTRGTVLGYDGLLVPGYYSSCCGGLAANAMDAIGPSPLNDVPPLHGREGEDVCVDAPVFRWTVERPEPALRQRLIAYGRAKKHGDLPKLARLTSIEVAASNRHRRPTRYAITDEAGLTAQLSAEGMRDAVNYDGSGLQSPKRRLWSSNITVAVRDGRAVFEGRGFGHGVGMCQYGAETLARDGRDYRGILAWYYPGADLVRAYA